MIFFIIISISLNKHKNRSATFDLLWQRRLDPNLFIPTNLMLAGSQVSIEDNLINVRFKLLKEAIHFVNSRSMC